ncbi:MAG: alpha/beta fold hydrolase, partial [Polyangiales bacterium]
QLADRAVAHWLGQDADEEAERRVRALVSAQPGERIVRTLRRLGQANGDRTVPRHDTPAILLHSREDRSIPFERSMRLAVRGRRSNELRPLPGAAHLLPLTHPALVAQKVFHG